MKVRLSIEYEVEDENPEIEKLGAELIRAEADALVESVKRKLRAPGAGLLRCVEVPAAVLPDAAFRVLGSMLGVFERSDLLKRIVLVDVDLRPPST